MANVSGGSLSADLATAFTSLQDGDLFFIERGGTPAKITAVNIKTDIDALQVADTSAFGRTWIDLADAAAGRGALNLGTIATAEQSNDPDFSVNAQQIPDRATIRTFVNAEIDSRTLGRVQVLTNAAGSRLANTSYQNTTGRPIEVIISGANTQNEIQVSTDNSNWITVGQTGQSGSFNTGVTFVVQNGEYYRCRGPFGRWTERR